MSKIINLKCQCGTVKGSLNVDHGSFFHVHCLCCDCQSFASFLNNKEKILDEHGGTELFQTYPAFIEITEGQEKMGCVQLREKGLFRWHTTCCNMPLANTMSSSKIPFVGVSVKFMQFINEDEKFQTLGPVTMKAFGKYAIGEMPRDAHSKFPISYIPKILSFYAERNAAKKEQSIAFFQGWKSSFQGSYFII